MKKVRVIASAALLTLTAFSAVTFTSCDKECEVGYEGSNCKTLSREKFLGSWKGDDQCGTGLYRDITVRIEPASGNEVTVLVTNMGGFGTSVVLNGTMTGMNSISIASQSTGANRTLRGDITMSGNDLRISYTSTDEDGDDVCNGVYTKL